MALASHRARLLSSLDTTGVNRPLSEEDTRYTTLMIKLLVVDDAPFVREIVRHALRATTIEIVAEAEDGQEAVELALRLKPDVILMDIVLPLKNGIDAAKEIISKMANQKIVAFSTNDTDSIVLKTLEAGCVSFLPKPFHRDELIAAIVQAAGKKLNEHGFAASE